MIDFERLSPMYTKMLELLIELHKFDLPPKDETDEFVVFLTRSVEAWENRYSVACAAQRELQAQAIASSNIST